MKKNSNELKNINEFEDYRDFLVHCSKYHPLYGGRGFLKAISQAAQCQPPYITQVLQGKANLSLEHAEAIARFLGLSDHDKHILLLLLQKERAGTVPLKKYFENQILELRKDQLDLKKRLQLSSSFSEEFKARYYSTWYYSAIHMALTISNLKNPLTIAKHLHLDLELVHEVLNFLKEAQIIDETNGLINVHQSALHLDRDSPYIRQHHLQWRMQAVKSLDKNLEKGFHYSAVFSLDQKDKKLIHEILAKATESAVKVISSSKEESLSGLTLDFFDL